jgi:hypothetical protein
VEVKTETSVNDSMRQMLRNQLFGRISVIQSMMLESVKDAQRQFPTIIYYKEEAQQRIKIGDKGTIIHYTGGRYRQKTYSRFLAKFLPLPISPKLRQRSWFLSQITSSAS